LDRPSDFDLLNWEAATEWGANNDSGTIWHRVKGGPIEGIAGRAQWIWTAANCEDEGAPGGNDSVFIRATIETVLAAEPATIDIDPDTLNLKSRGNSITCYIELPESYVVGDIVIESVILEETISAEASRTEIGDYDQDSITDLMVKFDRQGLIEYLDGTTGQVQLTVRGEVGGIPFEGSDTITVIE